MKEKSTRVKKKFSVPHVFVILVGLVIFAVLLTYLVPAGSYDRVVD